MILTLLSYRLAFILILTLPNLVFGAGTTSVDVRIQADIHSSMHMEWEKLSVNDQRYQDMKAKITIKDGWLLLPYGLYVELQTNDKDRMVSLRISDFVTGNKQNKINNKSVYVSINGESLQPASKDLALLYPEDRALLKKYILLFLVKTMPNHRSGKYSANFKFITNTLH